jgi:hypothetical protein
MDPAFQAQAPFVAHSAGAGPAFGGIYHPSRPASSSLAELYQPLLPTSTSITDPNALAPYGMQGPAAPDPLPPQFSAFQQQQQHFNDWNAINSSMLQIVPPLIGGPGAPAVCIVHV